MSSQSHCGFLGNSSQQWLPLSNFSEATMASLAPDPLENPPQPPGDRGTSALPASLQQVKPLPVTATGSNSGLGSGNGSPSLSSIPPPPPIFSQATPPSTPIGVVYSLTHSPAASSPPRLAQTLPGSFPDIYDGDMKKWEQHFHSIQRAYKEFGKEDDFAIRVLTEDFTLPFPFAWPRESEASRQPAYDPADCAGFDFFLHPGQPVPKILQPLHATTQAFFKKRRLEQLALSYASKASLSTMQGLPPPPESGPTLRPDIMVIASMPCMAATAAPSEPPFLLQDGKGHRNIQPATMATPNLAPTQPANLQFMNPTHHGPF